MNTGKGRIFCLLKPFTWLNHCWLALIYSENGNPLQYSFLDKFMDTGAWQATVHRVVLHSYSGKTLAGSGGLKGLQPKNYSDSKAKIVSSKFYKSYCIYLCRPFHSLHQNLSDIPFSSFHNGFLTDLQGKGWQGGTSWQFQKSISFFPINFLHNAV